MGIGGAEPLSGRGPRRGCPPRQETEGRGHPKRWGASPLSRLPLKGTEEAGPRKRERDLRGVGGPPPGRSVVAIAHPCPGGGAATTKPPQYRQIVADRDR